MANELLSWFQRIHLKVGETIKVNFLITPEMMSNFDNNGDEVLKNDLFFVKQEGSSGSRIECIYCVFLKKQALSSFYSRKHLKNNA